jgi:DhnA family fructose-bisphosphate aldolase class Ia
LIKTYYTGSPESFREVTENCPVPCLIAGGAKMNTSMDTLEVVEGAMTAGASGVVFGRNIWQNKRPAAMVNALKAIIHDNQPASEAIKLLA